MRSLLSTSVLFVTLVACSNPEPPSPSAARSTATADGMTAELVEGGVRLHNGTGAPVAYAVWDKGFLGLLGPCADLGPQCVRLPVGATRVVPNAEIAGYGATGTLAVHWWHVVPTGGGGHAATEVKTLELERS